MSIERKKIKNKTNTKDESHLANKDENNLAASEQENTLGLHQEDENNLAQQDDEDVAHHEDENNLAQQDDENVAPQEDENSLASDQGEPDHTDSSTEEAEQNGRHRNKNLFQRQPPTAARMLEEAGSAHVANGSSFLIEQLKLAHKLPFREWGAGMAALVEKYEQDFYAKKLFDHTNLVAKHIVNLNTSLATAHNTSQATMPAASYPKSGLSSSNSAQMFSQATMPVFPYKGV